MHVGLNLLFLNTSILCIKYSLITIILYHRPMPKMTCSFDSISWPGIGPDQFNSTTFHIETFYQDLVPPYISPRNGLIFSEGAKEGPKSLMQFWEGTFSCKRQVFKNSEHSGGPERKIVALKAQKAVLDVFWGTKISARFP